MTIEERVFGKAVESQPFCLGAAHFGSAMTREESFALMDAFFEAGGRVIDTAHLYADWHPQGSGMSERTVGAWLKERGLGDQVVISTKGGHPRMSDLETSRLRTKDIEQDIGDSLDRLGTDCIDLYWLHMDDKSLPVEDIIGSLNALIDSSRVKRIAASNWTTPRIEAANTYAAENGLSGFAASQPNWSLAPPNWPPATVPGLIHMEEADLRWYVKHRFPLVPYTAQAAGYFSEPNVIWMKGGFEGEAPLGAATYDSALNRGRLQWAAALAEEKGVTANQINLAFLLAQPMPVFPIVGTSKPERIPEIMESAAINLSEEELKRLVQKN